MNVCSLHSRVDYCEIEHKINRKNSQQASLDELRRLTDDRIVLDN